MTTPAKGKRSSRADQVAYTSPSQDCVYLVAVITLNQLNGVATVTAAPTCSGRGQ
jgi:hypothetical protein